MLSAFHAAGFEVWDVVMSDLVAKRVTLDERFRGVAFVGGFSFADVMGSAKGWAGVVKFHSDVLKQFSAFRDRKDTFSLGVCNGCQLMSLLGWVNPANASALEDELKVSATPRFIHNESGRYESRFVSVKIEKTNAVMLKGMEGSSLGVWVAHGEGRAHFTHPSVMQSVIDQKMVPLRYVDDAANPTEEYPFNPNGSPERYRRSRIARRSPLVHDAAPRARVPEVAVAISACRYATAARESMAEAVPERENVL
ncbi:hypothetical protein PINS_up020869 [Pythium insidiosum]|nr:hypothetical protein PINS_up020869 [Pythium insidiosum]